MKKFFIILLVVLMTIVGIVMYVNKEYGRFIEHELVTKYLFRESGVYCTRNACVEIVTFDDVFYHEDAMNKVLETKDVLYMPEYEIWIMRADE